VDLAISKRIIEIHGGKIWIDLEVGRGSTFAFTLPVIVGQTASARVTSELERILLYFQ
jgi:signal transduction histidine kinase